MFILSFVFSGSDFCSVNHTSLYQKSELKVFKNIKFLGEISKTFRNDLLGTDVQNLNDNNHCLQHYSGRILLL